MRKNLHMRKRLRSAQLEPQAFPPLFPSFVPQSASKRTRSATSSADDERDQRSVTFAARAETPLLRLGRYSRRRPPFSLTDFSSDAENASSPASAPGNGHPLRNRAGSAIAGTRGGVALPSAPGGGRDRLCARLQHRGDALLPDHEPQVRARLGRTDQQQELRRLERDLR